MSKKKPINTITLAVKTGDIAQAYFPGLCFLGKNAKVQEFSAPKIGSKNVALTLTARSALVKSGKYEAGTRVIIPTPGPMAYYIANADKGYAPGDTMIAPEDVSFTLDLDAPGVKFIPPAKVGPRGGVRGDRTVETAKTKANPQRAAQERSRGQARIIAARNRYLTRIGQPILTRETADAYITKMFDAKNEELATKGLPPLTETERESRMRGLGL